MPMLGSHQEARQASRNPLLVLDDVGRAAPTCRDLPEFGYCYGKGHQGDVEGAREIVSDWVTHNPSAKKGTHLTNHITKNKKLTSSTRNPKAQTNMKAVPTDVAPSHCFGTANRPSTPIGAVIECQFGAEYEHHANAMFAEGEQIKRETTGKFAPKMTKAAEGHAIGAERRLLAQMKKEEGPQEHFKLSKFKNVKSTFTVPK